MKFLLAFFVALGFGAPAVAAASPLELAAERVDGWPGVTVLADPTGRLGPGDVLARRAAFSRPDVPHANLGPRADAVWLRVPVRVPAGGDPRRIVSLEYASLDRIDLYVVGPGGISTRMALGRELLFSQRPWPTAWHAAEIGLPPGVEHELLLRVETRSTMIVPLTISTVAEFHAREAAAQALQGALAGAALCLLVYSLAQWFGLRDAIFLYYSLTLGGSTLFFLAYFGVGAQHFWGDHAWLNTHVAPLAVLVGLVGAFPFIDAALGMRELRPRLSLALRVGAVASALLFVGFAFGVVSYRVAQTGATLLGPLPMLLALPAAFQRWRMGERVGAYMLLGWGAYGFATLTMAGLLRGFAPANFWTQHSFQFGAAIEMVMWMRVLGLHTESLRTAAQRAHLERDALRSMAHSDALTGLANRRGLQEVLARMTAGCADDRLVVVYLLDLDGFKPVNDRFGHDVGDALLVGVGRRLQSLVRSSDLVARLGGDEFVVVVSNVRSEVEARAVGQKLLDAFKAPFEAAGQTCCVGLTIGYALAPLDARDPDLLLKLADAAMYAGKQAGRACVRRSAEGAGAAKAA